MSTQGLTEFREPWTIDVVLGFLDKIPFSTPFLILLPALTYLHDRFKNPAVANLSYTKLIPHVKNLIWTQNRWVGLTMAWILIKTFNKTANRYVRNHTYYRRDPIDYEKDVIVVTGGSAGIGNQIVQVLLYRKKATVVVLDMVPPPNYDTDTDSSSSGCPQLLYFKTDITDPEAVASVGKQIRQKIGTKKKVSVLINCAGVASGNTILDVNLQAATRVWKINTMANWVTCQEFLPEMIRSNHGHIVTVASSGAFASLPSMSEYATSKAAALAFHEVLAIELRTRFNAPRVRTTLLAPTKVRTLLAEGMEDHKDPFFTPVLEPIQVANKVVEALDSGLSQNLVMPAFTTVLPWLRVLPDWFRRVLAVVGDTDNQVTNKSMKRALEKGYGSHWQGEDKLLYDARKKLFATANPSAEK